MGRMDSNADFFALERISSLCVMAGQRSDLKGFAMSFSPFVSKLSVSRLSVVTAYLAFALVGAIVLGVF